MRDIPHMVSPALLAALLFTALAVLATAPAAAQTPAATLEAADGETIWQLNDDGGLAVFGETGRSSGFPTAGEGAVPVEGAGARLMWHPGKAAFRAGEVASNEWDDEYIGLFSMATGFRTTASGENATAMGYSTTASGSSSTTLGYRTTASASRATAMGENTTASGESSTAMGLHTTAANASSLTIGKYNDANTGGDEALFVVGNGDINNIKHGRSDALVLDESGDLWIAGTLTQSSDRRLKTNIAPLETGVLDALAEIRPVRYRFREGTGHPTGRQIGLIAQEVQRHFPELVAEGSDGHLSLSYSKLTAVLVKGLQEQQARIEALQARAERVDALEARLAALETKQADRQHAGWAWPAGALVLGLVLVGGLTWQRRA